MDVQQEASRAYFAYMCSPDFSFCLEFCCHLPHALHDTPSVEKEVQWLKFLP